jgi:nucleoside-diphosphate-sugar epimerase
LVGVRIAVTGGTGFLGFHIVRALTEAGAVVSVLARPASPRNRLAAFNPSWVEGSLESPEALSRLARGASVFIHNAGLTIAPSWRKYVEVNVEGTRRAVQAASAGSVPTFILVSSQAAGGPAPAGTASRREDDPPDPRSNYARSKLAAEEIVEREGTGIPSRIILRPGAIYGPYDKAFLAYFKPVERGIRAMLGRGQKIFQPVHAADVALACVAAAAKRPAGLNRYFIVGPATTTWEEFGAALARAGGRKPFCIRIPESLVPRRLLDMFPPTRGVADRLADLLADRWDSDPGRAERKLGWKAQISLEEGLRETWDWYRKNRWV